MSVEIHTSGIDKMSFYDPHALLHDLSGKQNTVLNAIIMITYKNRASVLPIFFTVSLTSL